MDLQGSPIFCEYLDSSTQRPCGPVCTGTWIRERKRLWGKLLLLQLMPMTGKKSIFLIRSQGWRSQMFYIVITTETGYTELIKFPNVWVGKEHFQMEGSGKACLVRNGLCRSTAKCVSVAITSCIWGWTLSGLGIQRCYKSAVLASCSSLTSSTIIKLLTRNVAGLWL